MPVTYDLYGDRSGNTRNVLVEPNRVSWLKRHFACIRYGPRSGTGRIPFCAARPGTAGVYTPRPRYGGQIAFWGLGAECQTGLCATQREGVVLDNLALQHC